MSTHEDKAWAALIAKVEAAGRAYGEKYAKPEPYTPTHIQDAIHALIGMALIHKKSTRYELAHWKRIGEINADARNKSEVR